VIAAIGKNAIRATDKKSPRSRGCPAAVIGGSLRQSIVECVPEKFQPHDHSGDEDGEHDLFPNGHWLSSAHNKSTQQSRRAWQRGGRKAIEPAGPWSFNFPQHLEPPALERVEIGARSLLCHRPVERCDVAAAVAVAPLDEPMAAALAIQMDADLTHERIVPRGRRVVEALAALQPSDPRRVEGVFEISGDDFLEGSRPGGVALPLPSRLGLRSVWALRHGFAPVPARQSVHTARRW
jgi:hypothetical protein